MCWRPYLVAWRTLQPHWSLDISDWTPQDALCFPVPDTTSTRSPTGLRLVDLVTWDATTSAVSLRSPDDVTDRHFGAPGKVKKALTALRDGSSKIPSVVLELALSDSSVSLARSTRHRLHVHIQVAGVMLFSLTTALARRFIDRTKGINRPLDWRSRGITKLGRPPIDIWQRLHHRARTPRQKETFYKFLFNALALGTRARHFRNATADRAWCHFCPGQVQTQRHFIWTCPLAQCLWREFRDLFSLPRAVTLHEAAFSWSTQAQVLGRRYGYRLQAGHAVAVHTLWLVHVRVVFHDGPASFAAVKALFRSLLRQHLETLRAAALPERRAQFLVDWSPPLNHSFPLSL